MEEFVSRAPSDKHVLVDAANCAEEGEGVEGVKLLVDGGDNLETSNTSQLQDDQLSTLLD